MRRKRLLKKCLIQVDLVGTSLGLVLIVHPYVRVHPTVGGTVVVLGCIKSCLVGVGLEKRFIHQNCVLLLQRTGIQSPAHQASRNRLSLQLHEL